MTDKWFDGRFDKGNWRRREINLDEYDDLGSPIEFSFWEKLKRGFVGFKKKF